MKQLMKQVARGVVGDYELYWIYGITSDMCPPEALAAGEADVERIADPAELGGSPDAGLRQLVEYSGTGAHGFVARVGGVIAAACWYWDRERYRSRAFLELREGEAKLVQITTAGAFRRRGIASALTIASARAMAEDHGYRRMFCRVWVGHRASMRTFERACWRRLGLIASGGYPWTHERWRVTVETAPFHHG